jgi:hypothetical protein
LLIDYNIETEVVICSWLIGFGMIDGEIDSMRLMNGSVSAESGRGGPAGYFGGETGLSMVEILASVIILSVMAGAVFSAIHMGQGLNMRMVHRTQAETLIDGKLDSLFVVDFNNVAADTSLIIIDPRDLSIAGDGLVGTLFVNIEGMDDPLDKLGTKDPGWPDTTDHKRIELVIRWPDVNGDQDVTRESLRSNPGP